MTPLELKLMLADIFDETVKAKHAIDDAQMRIRKLVYRIEKEEEK